MTLSSAGNFIIPSTSGPAAIAIMSDPAISPSSLIIVTCSTADANRPFVANIRAGSQSPGSVTIVVTLAGAIPIVGTDQCTVNYMIIN